MVDSYAAWSCRAGRNPFGICLSADAKYAWPQRRHVRVSVAARRDAEVSRRLAVPRVWRALEGTEEGVVAEGRAIRPGSPNPDAMSVFKVELRPAGSRPRSRPATWSASAAISTPSARQSSTVVAGEGSPMSPTPRTTLISVIDVHNAIVDQVEPLVPGLKRGAAVLLDALSPDEQSLYVACAGLNAVAGRSGAVEAGRLHSGRLVLPLRTSARRQAAVRLQCQGVGSGPNGARFRAPGPRLASGRHHAGTVPGDRRPDPAGWPITRQVVANTYRSASQPTMAVTAAAAAIASQSHSAHRVHRQGEPHLRPGLRERKNVAGDPTLAAGCHVTVVNKAGEGGGRNMLPQPPGPADRFALCDNFYCD